MVNKLQNEERKPCKESDRDHFADEDRCELARVDDGAQEYNGKEIDYQGPDLADNDQNVASLHLFPLNLPFHPFNERLSVETRFTVEATLSSSIMIKEENVTVASSVKLLVKM